METNNIEAWSKQIWYWRTHLDVFIEQVLSHPNKPIKFMPFQKAIIRAVGNHDDIIDVESRSLGKTWKMAYALMGIAILYPSSPIIVVSKTLRQAMFVIKYIDTISQTNPNVAKEIASIKVSRESAVCIFKNGSRIESGALSSDGSNLRGNRAKILYIDESAWVKSDVINSVIRPIIQYKRDIYWKYAESGFIDYNSKIIQTSSAYLKSCEFYDRFKMSLKFMNDKSTSFFSCAINYKTGVRYGIIDDDFVFQQKRQMPISSWEMEWNARFIGNSEMSYFSYEITEPCRVLEKIELLMPKGSKSRYIISCDIATSAGKNSDNAVLIVLKFSEQQSSFPNAPKTFLKQLVYIKSYNGYSLDKLAKEIRKLSIRFPNTEKIIIDINGIGEGIVSLLGSPFVDDNDKEHLPLILDDSKVTMDNCIPIIRGIKANNQYNNRIATATRMYFENMSLQIPVTSTLIRYDIEQSEKDKELVLEKLSVFIETDALQYELGNIIPKITTSGNVIYETSSPRLHKDRYSSLAMGLEYIYTLEQEFKGEVGFDEFLIGCSYKFDE